MYCVLLKEELFVELKNGCLRHSWIPANRVSQVGLTQVSGDPVSRMSVTVWGGVPISTSTVYRVPDQMFFTSTSFWRAISRLKLSAVGGTIDSGARMKPSPRTLGGGLRERWRPAARTASAAEAATEPAKSEPARRKGSISR